MFHHQFENLWRPSAAVFNGFDSRENGAAHSFGGVGVDGHGDAGAGCRLHSKLQFTFGKCRVRPGQGSPAVVGIELDPIGSVSDLIAHDADQLCAVSFFGALRDAPLRSVALGAVSACGDDGSGGCQDAGAGNNVLCDRLFELDVGIACAFGAQLAYGGEAGRERGAEMIHGAGCAQSQTFAGYLIVPHRFVIGMEQDVGMALYQARHQGGVGEIDHAATGDIDGGACGFYLVAFYADSPAFMHRGAVEDSCRAEDGDGGGLRAGGSGEQYEEEGSHHAVIIDMGGCKGSGRRQDESRRGTQECVHSIDTKKSWYSCIIATMEKQFAPTRRRLLGGAAATAAALLMPPNVRRALAQQPPRAGSLSDIKHVVVLMQENRSFDHYFGTLAGVRGFDDPDALKLSHGKSVFYQPDRENPKGYLLPFHLDTHSSSAQKIPSTSHAWAVQHLAWNNGRMDQWLPAHRDADGVNGPYVMGYYKRADIPFQFALAEAFTICDGYHCSVFGPTWPNRMYLMTGMIDPDGTGGGPILNNTVPAGGYTWTTYPERLQTAGVSWKVYKQKDSYGCNMLENFKVFQQAQAGSPLYVKGMQVDPEGQFEYDAMHDKLPAVSWIIPTSFQSEHPNYMPADGAAFVASKIDAIAANPDVWAKTVFILNYDENDGLFDHVPPPTPPQGTPQEFVGGLPIGGGFRVPCIIVSPWTAGGWVSGERFDHTSVLQFLEAFTGVREPNISEWRRRTFGNLTPALRLRDARSLPPVLPDTSGVLTLARYGAEKLPKPVLPGSEQEAPQQEKGNRKRVSPA